MSSSHGILSESGVTRQEAASAAPEPAGAYVEWLGRAQRSRARHAAITKNLYTWSNYKSWADRVKNSWDDESSKK